MTEYWKGQGCTAQCSHSRGAPATEMSLLLAEDKGHRVQQETNRRNHMLSRASRLWFPSCIRGRKDHQTQKRLPELPTLISDCCALLARSFLPSPSQMASVPCCLFILQTGMNMSSQLLTQTTLNNGQVALEQYSCTHATNLSLVFSCWSSLSRKRYQYHLFSRQI